MATKLCGVCFRSYVNLKQHLNVSHTIPNKEEFCLLMKYGNARTSDNLDCPVCERVQLVRLDKHLQDSHSLKAEERESLLKDAKRRRIAKEFAALRRTGPEIPMVSGLGDLTSDDEVYERMSSWEDDMPLDEEQPLTRFMGAESVHGQPEIGPPALSSTPEQQHLSPGGKKTSSYGHTSSCTGVHTASSSAVHTASSSAVHTASSSAVHTGSPGVLTSSSGRGHDHPLSSSPVVKNRDDFSLSCNMESPLPNRGNCNCKCNCENVAVRLQQLEHMVDKLMRAQPSTPKTSRGITSKLTASAQKHEHVRKLEKPENVFQRLIDDFRKFRLGSRTARKDQENARQAASHALRFCLYMATGLTPKSVSMDLKFLLQMDKLRAYPLYLAQKGYVPTTVRNMMTNVIMFIKHVKCSFQGVSKVKSTEFERLLYEFKMLQANVHKHVVVHRQKVTKKKTEQLLDAKEEVTFMKVAKKKIPELLHFLPGEGSFGKKHSRLMGYLMGYLSILTGHRAVVFTNMTRDQVVSADCWDGGKKYRILVDDHKTMRSFGQAAVCLNKTEFGWVKKAAFGECCVCEEGNIYVFHTIFGRHIVKPSLFLNMAWVDAGLKGPVDFSLIRSSVSTQAKIHLTEKERKEVAHSMCHDPTTAEKFYVALPDKNMAYQTRKLRMKALKEAFVKSSQDLDDSDDSSSLPDDKVADTPETSSDDEEVVYDDGPDSSSSLSSDAKFTLLERRKRRRGFSKPSDESSKNETVEDEPPSYPDPSRPKSKSKVKVSAQANQDLSEKVGEISRNLKVLSSQDSLPSAQPRMSKRKLDFSAEESLSQMHVYTPSKCVCVVERLREPIADYFSKKSKLLYPVLGQEPMAETLPAPLVEQTTRFTAAPAAQEEPRSNPEPLTPEKMLQTEEKDAETPEDEMPQTQADPGCVPDPMIQETSESVQETPEDQMPQTQAEPGCVPDPMIQETSESVQETPEDEMPQTQADPGCVPDPMIQETSESVQETPEDQMPQTQAEPGCVPDPMIQETSESVQETPEDQMPQTQAEEV